MQGSDPTGGARRSLKGDKVSVTGDLTSGASAVDPGAKVVSERFLLQQLLGQGGMGNVFVAQDRGLGRVVALKLLRDELESDRTALRRFMLEAQIGAQLEHPNIVPLYSFERTEGGAPAITMQLLEGKTMTVYIEEAARAPARERAPRGPFALKERLGRLLGVCDAMHFAHERGVVHRDLKPDNVMLGQHHEVYVMDWGLARVVSDPDAPATAPSDDELASIGTRPTVVSDAPAPSGDDLPSFGTLPTVASDARTPSDDDVASIGTRPTIASDPRAPSGDNLASFGTLPTIASEGGTLDSAGVARATQQGQVMGTPQYMPPEQALGRIEHVGPAADQYALGVMLLELATLLPARSHTNSMLALSEAFQGHLAKSIDVDGRPLEPALAAIVTRATQVAIRERYPSVRELAEDVRRFVRGEPVSVYAEGIARQLTRAAARRPALSTGIVAGLVLLGAAGVIGVLARSAGQARHHAYDMEGSRRVLVAVSRKAHEVDVRLSDLAAAVQAIAGAATESLELDGGAAPLKPTPELNPSPAYGGALESFEQAVPSWPGMATGEPMPLSAAKLLGIEHWLKRALFSGLPEALRSHSEIARKAALFEGRGVLLRCFVGLEDGSFVQYPAREIAANHDPRERPWYRMAKGDPSLHWTRPIVDAAGKTVRMQASVGMVGSSGAFIGVTGCDLRVSFLARELGLDLPGFRRAYLVTEDAKVAVSEGLEASVLARTKDVNAEPELPAVEDAELVARVTAGDQGGYVLASGGRVLVYSRLISPPWTYVAELDSTPYLSR